MVAVMLTPGWPGSFRRSVRDKKDKIKKVLVFEHGKPQTLEDDDFAAVWDDVGKALVYAATDAEGKPLGKPDWQATEEHAGA